MTTALHADIEQKGEESDGSSSHSSSSEKKWGPCIIIEVSLVKNVYFLFTIRTYYLRENWTWKDIPQPDSSPDNKSSN